MTMIAKELTIELKTDSFTTFSGFEADYVACFDKRNDTTRDDDFVFPIYLIEEKMRCFLDIQVTSRRSIIIKMVINSNMIYRECKDIVKINADGNDVTNTRLQNCSLNAKITLDITLSSLLRLIFTSVNRLESVSGNYTSEEPKEETTTGASIELSYSQQFTTVNINTDVASIVVPITLLLILSVVATVAAVLYKRGVISVKLPWKSDSTYEDPLQYTPDNQYADPSRTLSEQSDNTAYQNEKFEKGGRPYPYQNYYNVEDHERRDKNAEGTYETTEQQYETQFVHIKQENEHQYSELKI